MDPESVILDPTLRSTAALDFEVQLQHQLVGQPEAAAKATQLVQTFMAGFNPSDRPAGVLLMLGPTGTGKTRLVETIAEILFGNPKAFFKIACAEYQDSYQTNRLLGAPPGYIGYIENKGEGMLSQEKLEQFQTPDMKLNLILFDEIEKAHDRLFDVMLNILDKGEMTTSNGRGVDFTQTLIFMTSNLGTSQLGKTIGFTADQAAVVDRSNTKTIEEAVKTRFRPEFLNRIDHQVMFKTLQPDHLRAILHLEVDAVRRRLQRSSNHSKFIFVLSTSAEDALLKEGFSPKFGARHLKRVLEQRVVQPLANMTMSGQIAFGDLVFIDSAAGQFLYRRYNGDQIAQLPAVEWGAFRAALQDATVAT
jgi:ATP-dependent Clp protease ATP-binding subunit ClpA